VSQGSENAKHLAKGTKPVGDSTSKETSIDEIETCFGILKTKIDIINLRSVGSRSTGVEYLETQIVGDWPIGFILQDRWGQVNSQDLGPGKDFSELPCPDPTSASDVDDLDRGMADWDPNARLPKFTHRPMNGVQTIPFRITIYQFNDS
jgi:hypothetical protein